MKFIDAVNTLTTYAVNVLGVDSETDFRKMYMTIRESYIKGCVQREDGVETVRVLEAMDEISRFARSL